jgi:P63C domain
MADPHGAVLENGQRVLSQAEFLEALGRHRKANVRKEESEEPVPPILQGKAINPFISRETLEKSRPVRFKTISGVRASGYRADLLPDVCEIYLKARDAGQLPKNQEHVARQAEILIRGLASVGIIALVDEATGFQYDRPRRELEHQLKRFLSERLRKWVRTFPADYFKHLCRLRNIELRADMHLPQYFGRLTNNLVYRRLAPGLLKRLKERREERGSPNNKLHSWLSEDVGFREVLVHLGTVVGLMKLRNDYAAFERQLDTVAPTYPEHPGLFDDPKDWE